MSDDIKKGLLGIVVDETEVSKVMPEINSLTYRGYAAQDLCAKCKFEEVAYLILNGELPNKKQLKAFEKQEKFLSSMLAKAETLRAEGRFRPSAEAIKDLRAAVSICGRKNSWYWQHRQGTYRAYEKVSVWLEWRNRVKALTSIVSNSSENTDTAPNTHDFIRANAKQCFLQ